MSVHPPAFFDLFEPYFRGTDEPTLANFVANRKHSIVASHQYGEKLDIIWKNRYHRAYSFYYRNHPRASKPPRNVDDVKWEEDAVEILNNERKSDIASISAGSISTANDTSTAAIPVTTAFVDEFRSLYASMNNDLKWVLKSGKTVEHVLFEYGLQLQYESSVHSFIIDLSDKKLCKNFTAEELTEIHSLHAHPLPPIHQELLEYLNSFSSLATIDDLEKHARKRLFDFETQFELDWAQFSIQNVLRLFRAKYLPLTDQSDEDLIHRIWGFVDTAFDDVDIDVRTGLESAASSARKNFLREPNAPKMHGDQTSILFSCAEGEIGCAEFGKNDGGDAESELGLKVPKLMRDMMWSLSQHGHESQEKLAIVGFVMTGLKLRALALDRPTAYVCRLSRTTPRFFPSTADSIATQLGDLLGLVSQIKQLAYSTRGLLRPRRQVKSAQLELPTDVSHELFPCPASPRREGSM